MSNTRITAWPTGQHEEVRARIAAHRAADEIIQGFGWDAGKGCAIGFSLDHYSHGEYARVLGVSLEVAKIVDTIHEGLLLSLALDWPGRVAEALRPGADTTHVGTRFAVWLLREERPSDDAERVACLYERCLVGDEPTHDEWKAVRPVVTAGDVSVVYWAAEQELAWAAEDAATEWAAEAEDARESYRRMADALIEILASL